MNTLLALAHNDLRLFLRDKSGYVWLFIVPFLFVFFFGMAFKRDDGEPSNPRPWVLIDNRDPGFMGDLVVDALDAQGLRVVAPDAEEADGIKRGIRIPEYFTESIQKREAVKLELFTVEGGSLEANQMLQSRLIRALILLNARLLEMGTSEGAEPIFREEPLVELMRAPSQVPLEVGFAGKAAIPSGFGQSIPGMLVMFLLMNLVIYGGSTIAEERRNGVLSRLLVNPITKRQLVMGRIAGLFLLAMVQMTFYAILAFFWLDVRFEGNVAALATTLFLYAWGCAALGVLIGGLMTNPDKVVGLGVLSANVMGALGGCWWPMEVVPDTMKLIGHFFPTAWAMDALHQLISFGGGWGQIQTELVVMIVFALGTSILAVRFLRH